MAQFKDVFVSYGRRESKAFARRLAERLAGEGFSVWFDQNDIPLGVDFQDQIDEGIEQAHNFIFIIAPHAVASPYCGKEIELAIKRGKRIIPLLHVDEGVDFDLLHPTIQKINWIYMRQKPSDAPLADWEDLDDLEAGYQGICTLLGSEAGYVAQHTELLHQAIAWEKHQRSTEWLLVGKEREEAEQWLKRDFAPHQPPCQPTALHCEFISESKKNAHGLMTDVFVSYASENMAFRDEVVNALARYAITAWTHTRDIQKGTDFEKAIYRGVEQADNLLFFISRESVRSEWCLKELAHAHKYQKRVIPLLIEPVAASEIPASIRTLQYIDFTDNKQTTKRSKNEKSDFERDIDEILAELKQDEEYHREHKMFLVLALKWERQSQNPAILLRGFNLDRAKTWLDSGKRREKHPPTELHERFIEESIAKIGQLHTEVFVSYSRKDGDFARKLNNALQSLDKTTWFDQESIADGADFQQEIYRGIEQADNFLFILSPDAIQSTYCADEVAYAEKLGKRFITILHREINPDDQPEPLRAVQWINFMELGFEKGFARVIRSLNIDREHVAEHSKLSQQALEWDKKDRPGELLLRGNAFAIAQNWLEEADSGQKQPRPTPLQRQYLEEAQNAILIAKRKEKRTLLILRGLLVAAVWALLVAVYFIFDANLARRNALSASEKAIAAERATQKALERSEADRQLAEEERTNAQIAQQGALKAQEATRQALLETEAQRDLATAAQARAIRNFRQAKANNMSFIAFSLLEKDPTLALALAMEAWQATAPDPPTLNAIKSLALIARTDSFRYQVNIPHQRNVYSVAASPDGQYIVSGSEDGVGRVFDFSGKKLGEFTGHQDYLRFVRFSPAGRQLATCGYDSLVIIRQFPSTKEQMRLLPPKGQRGRIFAFDFSPDGRYMASGQGDGAYLHIWDNKGQLIRSHQIKLDYGQQDAQIRYLEWISPTEVLCMGYNTPPLRFNVATDTAEFANIIPRSYVFDRIADSIYCTASNSNLQFSTFHQGQFLNLRLPFDATNRLIYDQEHGQIWMSGIVNDMLMYEVSADRLHHLKGHRNNVFALDYNAKQRKLISGSNDQTVKIWPDQPIPSYQQPSELASQEPGYLLDRAGRKITNYADTFYLRKGDQIVSKLLFSSFDWGKNLNSSTYYTYISYAKFSPDHRWCALAAYPKDQGPVKLLLLDQNLSLVKKIALDFYPDASEFYFDPKGQYLFVVPDNTPYQIMTLELKTLRWRHEKPYDPTKPYRTVLQKHYLEQDQLLTYGSDNRVIAWQLPSLRPIVTFDDHGMNGYNSRWVTAVALSPDGRTYASVGANHEIMIWDRGGKILKRISGYAKFASTGYYANSSTNGPQDLAFSHNGRALAVVIPYLYKVIVMSLEGKEITSYDGNYYTKVRFSPDDHELIFPSERKKVVSPFGIYDYLKQYPIYRLTDDDRSQLGFE